MRWLFWFTPELLRLFRERLVELWRKELQEVLEHAQERGELREDSDIQAAVNILVGSYYAQYSPGLRSATTGPKPSSKRYSLILQAVSPHPVADLRANGLVVASFLFWGLSSPGGGYSQRVPDGVVAKAPILC